MKLDDFAAATTTVDLGKEWNDLSEVELLPEDWYKVEIFKSEIKKNRKWLDGIDEAGHKIEAKEIEGAGNNFLLILKTINTSNPAWSNRTFFKYLPLPNPTDEGKFNMNGRDIADSKRSDIYIWAEAFEAPINGTNVTFKTKLVAQIYVRQGKDQNGLLVNELQFDEPRKVTELDNAITGAEGLL